MGFEEDSFYLTLPSHDWNKAFVKTNMLYKFSILLPGKMTLDIQEWEVGLAEIFIPDYGFNIKHSRNEGLKITYERVINDKSSVGLLK